MCLSSDLHQSVKALLGISGFLIVAALSRSDVVMYE